VGFELTSLVVIGIDCNSNITSSLHVFSEVRVAQPLVFREVFYTFLFIPFLFGHAIVWASSIYGFLLLLITILLEKVFQ